MKTEYVCPLDTIPPTHPPDQWGERHYGLAVLMCVARERARPDHITLLTPQVSDGTDARRGQRHSGDCLSVAADGAACDGISPSPVAVGGATGPRRSLIGTCGQQKEPHWSPGTNALCCNRACAPYVSRDASFIRIARLRWGSAARPFLRDIGRRTAPLLARIGRPRGWTRPR